MRASLYQLGALLLLLCAGYPAQASTTLLPNGMQCFTDANGVIVSGSMNMFYPATTTPKPNWQDSGQVTLNSQPIQLDANGCATIYGIGSYRQQLYDGAVVGGNVSGNLIWDKVTTDTSAFNSVFWASVAAGTPNVITIVDTGFNGTDGTVINFTALSTNTGATTLNPSAYGAIAVVKDTTGGPIALVGGEIIQNNTISVIYRSVDNAFHILNPPIQSASGSTSPLCGASNLKITATSNASVTITADQAVTQSAAGLVLNRSTVSTSVNITTGTVTSTAGGMDGEAVGTSAWLYIFLIDNGSAINAIGAAAAGNGTSPTLPSGYTYKCRIGAVRVDGSSNLYRSVQRGRRFQWVLNGGSGNTTVFPTISSAANVSYTAAAVAAAAPPTASAICVQANTSANNSNYGIAPNANYSTIGGGTAIPPIAYNSTTTYAAYLIGCIVLESTNIYSYSNTGTLTITGYQYIDAVNAN